MSLARVVGVVVFLLVAIACDTAAPVDESAAEAAVRELFAALDRGDCVAMRRVIPSLTSDAICRDYLDEWHERQTTLLAVRSVERDGRDSHTFLVHTRLRIAGRERDAVSRAVPTEDGHWVIDP